MESPQFRRRFPGVQPPATVSSLMVECGLGYLKMGQPATTLSGGEAQRIKLAKELGRRATGRTLYLLDEPSRGLHPADAANLIKVLQGLVDTGNTVVIVEHNLDLVKVAPTVAGKRAPMTVNKPHLHSVRLGLGKHIPLRGRGAEVVALTAHVH